MAEEGLGDMERGLALGAGIGFLLAQALGFDIGLGLVMGALVGVAWIFLLPRGGAGG